MKNAHEQLYNIRQVIELTGITEFALRAWEGRYDCFEPARTPTGRRLYRRDDILKIKALLDLTARGFRISKLVHYNLEQLQKLLETREPATEVISETTTNIHKPIADKNTKEISLLFKYADRFDWQRVLNIIYKKRKSSEPIAWIFDFLLPLISQINFRVSQEQFSISQEHIITSFIKENLFAIRSEYSYQTGRSKKSIVLATPEGDIHELGILISSVIAAVLGVKTLYLGPNVPKQDLCDSCLRFQATHVLISATITPQEGARDDLLNYINFIDRHLNKDVSLWLAGPSTMGLSLSLNRKLKILNSLDDLHTQLQNKRSEL